MGQWQYRYVEHIRAFVDISPFFIRCFGPGLVPSDQVLVV